MKLTTKLALDLLSLLAFALGVGWASGPASPTHLPSQRGWVLAFLLAVVFATGCGSASPLAPKEPVCQSVVDVPAHDVCEIQFLYPTGYVLVCSTVPATFKQVCN